MRSGYVTTSLYSGSKFKGVQTSGRSSYEVLVELKVPLINPPFTLHLFALTLHSAHQQHVDIENSLLCGYLQIKGLTAVCWRPVYRITNEYSELLPSCRITLC